MSKKQYYLKKLREKIEECGQILIEIDFQQQCCLEELEDYLNHLKEDDFDLIKKQNEKYEKKYNFFNR